MNLPCFSDLTDVTSDDDDVFLCPAAVMSEEAVRRTRSQKRALERESLPADSKRLKLDGVERSRASSILSGGEVKATIKVELQTRDEPMDVSAGNT